MRTLHSYDYAIVRVVPRVEREEFVNAGVILSCPSQDFLESRIELDERRLLAIDPSVDLEAVRTNLASIPVICAGGVAAGPIGKLSAARALPLARVAAQHNDSDLCSAHRTLRTTVARTRSSGPGDGQGASVVRMSSRMRR